MSAWYYVRNGQQNGPVGSPELRDLVAQGQLGPDDLVWAEGMVDWQPARSLDGVQWPLPSAAAEGVRATSSATQPLFLYVPISRFILLSIVSGGMYEAYWIYKNWQYVKERDHLEFSPFWRGFFGLFYCHSLLRRIHEDQQARRYVQPSFSPGGLTTGWVLLRLAANFGDRATGFAETLICCLIPAYLFLLPVQKHLNAVARKQNPKQPYYGWSAGHIVCLVWGACLWSMILFGLPGGEDSSATERIQGVIQWLYPALTLSLIIVAAQKRNLPGKSWLMLFLGVTLMSNLGWHTPQIMALLGDSDAGRNFYKIWGVPLHIAGLIGWGMLFPFLLSFSQGKNKAG